MVPTAYLRAFSPLDAFPPAERDRWRAYVRRGAGVTVSQALDAEHQVAAARLLTGRGPMQEDAALVRRVNGAVHVCPLQLELRAAAALRELRLTVPDEVVAAFVPDPGVRDTLDVLGASGRTPHILERAWIVPLHWFVLFEADERHYVDPPEGRGARLTYLTVAGLAAERIERAIDIVEATLEDGEDILADLADVAVWVDGFSDAAVLELDYGTVAGLFPWQELEQDRTCHEIWAALDGLRDGDIMAAAAYYGVARSRWGGLREKQYTS